MSQTAFALRFVPLLQQPGEGGEELLLQVIHPASVESVGLGVLADGEALHKPLLKVIPVVRQNCCQRIVQKTQVLFQFAEITFGNGSIPLLVYTEAILAQIEAVVLAELPGVCVVGGGLLIARCIPISPTRV